MKKLSVIILSIILCISMTACGKTQPEPTPTPTATPVIEENSDTNILDKASEHIKVVYGNTPADDIVEISDEYKAAIYEAIPILAEYPEAYQEYIIKAKLKTYNRDNKGEDLIESLQCALQDYYHNGNDEKYGPGPAGTEPETPEIGQSFGGNTYLGTGVTEEDLIIPEYEYTEDTSTAKALDTPTAQYGSIALNATGEYIDGKMVYRDEFGNLYHIYEDGTIDDLGVAQDVMDEWAAQSGPGGKINWNRN